MRATSKALKDIPLKFTVNFRIGEAIKKLATNTHASVIGYYIRDAENIRYHLSTYEYVGPQDIRSLDL